MFAIDGKCKGVEFGLKSDERWFLDELVVVDVVLVDAYIAVRCSFHFYLRKVEFRQFINRDSNFTPGTRAEYDGQRTFDFS